MPVAAPMRAHNIPRYINNSTPTLWANVYVPRATRRTTVTLAVADWDELDAVHLHD